jgi:hypothetical protein
MDSAEILLARQTYAQTNEFNNVIPATARDGAIYSPALDGQAGFIRVRINRIAQANYICIKIIEVYKRNI